MDRCPLCRAQAYFYGLQTRPLTARWIVCYACRGLKQTATGYPDAYTFRTDSGEVGTVASPPHKGFFKTGKETWPDKQEVPDEVE